MTDFAVYRFVAGLGVGGVFGLAVALCADSLPDLARPSALGLLQALSAVGNMIAGITAVLLGYRQALDPQSGQAWKFLFFLGAIPPLICVAFQFKLKEPEKWIKARAEGKITGARFGSYASLLGEARWRKPALFGGAAYRPRAGGAACPRRANSRPAADVGRPDHDRAELRLLFGDAGFYPAGA